MSGGQTINTKPTKRPQGPRPRGPHDDPLLYRRVETKGGAVRYEPWGRVWNRGALPFGCTLVRCTEHSTSYQTLDPQVTDAQAALLAASEVARDAMARALLDASRERPAVRTMTPRERAAWEAYCQALGEPGLPTLEISCINDLVDAGLKALRDAVEKCRATDLACATMGKPLFNPKECR